jgi:SH3-like domain-containing protein
MILWMVMAFFGLIQPVKSYAQGPEVFNNSGLPIPRFVSLRSDKVFVRTGPAQRYPIKWIFVKKGMPIEIIQEFDTWRKIRDIKGDEGWIHQALLSGKRNAIVVAEEGAMVLRKAKEGAKPVALMEKNVQLVLEECRADWCKVEAGDFSGWTKRNLLWGVYEAEELD